MPPTSNAARWWAVTCWYTVFLWFISKQQRQKCFFEITILTCGNTPTPRSYLEWLAPSQLFYLATLDFLIGIWLGNFLPNDLWLEAFCFMSRFLQCPNQQSGLLETCSPIHTEYITPNDNTLLPAQNPTNAKHTSDNWFIRVSVQTLQFSHYCNQWVSTTDGEFSRNAPCVNQMDCVTGSEECESVRALTPLNYVFFQSLKWAEHSFLLSLKVFNVIYIIILMLFLLQVRNRNF